MGMARPVHPGCHPHRLHAQSWIDLVFALIGAGAGAGNAAIVTLAFSLARKQADKVAPPEVADALAEVAPEPSHEETV